MGIGVVRALDCRVSLKPTSPSGKRTHLTTTTWKSGRGGAVFLNGVDGL